MIQLKVNGGELYKRVSRLRSLVSDRLGQDYAGRIRFDVSPSMIKISFFNGSISVVDSCLGLSFSCSGQGSFLVPADTFIKFLSSKKCDLEIIVSEANYSMEIRYRGGSFSGVWFGLHTYPAILPPPADANIFISSTLFVPELRRAFSFLSDDDMYKGINKVLLEVKDENLHLVCTDRFKLFKSTQFFGSGLSFSSLIIKPAAEAIFNYFSDEAHTIRISSDGRRTFFDSDGVTIGCIELEEKYPDYLRLFNMFKPVLEFDVSRDVFMAAIKSLNVSEADKVGFKVADSVLLSENNEEKRIKVEEDIPFLSKSGEDHSFSISSKDLSTSINSIKEKELTFALGNNALMIYSKENKNVNILLSIYNLN